MTDEELKKTQDNDFGTKDNLVQSFDSREINDKDKATVKETDRNETDNIEDVSGTFSSKVSKRTLFQPTPFILI